MKIGIVGLGFVGLSLTSVLASKGYRTVGIDIDKRKCEKDSNFGEEFIRLSRDIHFLNDTRAKIKLDINNHTGSKIKEIKEYTSY